MKILGWKKHTCLLKPFESKQIRLATGTTGKIETPTFKIFRREAGCLWFDIFIMAYRWYVKSRVKTRLTQKPMAGSFWKAPQQ